LIGRVIGFILVKFMLEAYLKKKTFSIARLKLLASNNLGT